MSPVLYKVMAGDIELGQASLVSLDRSMAVAIGPFAPTARYCSAQEIFRALSRSIAEGRPTTNEYRARDLLELRLVDHTGAVVQTEWIMIYDLPEVEDLEAEVKFRDPQILGWSNET